MILVVTSDKDLVSSVRTPLERAGYDVLHAPDCGTAVARAQRELPDLVLLDLTCPKADARSLARGLRADSRTATIPILLITGRKDEADLTLGLTLAADDYVTRPLDGGKLLERVGRILRRPAEQAPPRVAEGGATLKVGPLSIDTIRREVKVGGHVLDLTLPEFRLLTALAQSPGETLTRPQLLERSQGTDVFITDRAIDVQVAALRRKLGKAGVLLRTVRGEGYQLVAAAPGSAPAPANR